MTVFDAFANEYDVWFDENQKTYQAEIKAVKKFFPKSGSGIEIGVGTGRFAFPLGIQFGVDPSNKMAQIANKRNVATCQGIGEFLPFSNNQFDFVPLVTVVCFVDNLAQFFHEVRRVIKPDGKIIIGFIDKNSDLGRKYELHKNENKFYKKAHFYSVPDISICLKSAGFCNFKYNQTILGLSQEAKVYGVLEGYNQGAFVTICATKTSFGEKHENLVHH